MRRTRFQLSTTAKLAVTALVIGFCATALYAATQKPGLVHEELGCTRYGGKFTNLNRLVCEAVVHGPAKKDWFVRYEEVNGQSGYQRGQDPILLATPNGRCRNLP